MPLPAPSLRPLHPKGAWPYKWSGATETSQPHCKRVSKASGGKMPRRLKTPGCGMVLLSPILRISERLEGRAEARCETRGEVSAPAGTEGFSCRQEQIWVELGKGRALLPKGAEGCVRLAGGHSSRAPWPGRSPDPWPTGQRCRLSPAPLRLLLGRLRQRTLHSKVQHNVKS